MLMNPIEVGNMHLPRAIIRVVLRGFCFCFCFYFYLHHLLLNHLVCHFRATLSYY